MGYTRVRYWTKSPVHGLLNSLLAVGWEVAEWWSGGVVDVHPPQPRAGDRLPDTLGDEVLGILGAALAGVLVTRQRSGTTP